MASRLLSQFGYRYNSLLFHFTPLSPSVQPAACIANSGLNRLPKPSSHNLQWSENKYEQKTIKHDGLVQCANRSADAQKVVRAPPRLHFFFFLHFHNPSRSQQLLSTYPLNLNINQTVQRLKARTRNGQILRRNFESLLCHCLLFRYHYSF